MSSAEGVELIERVIDVVVERGLAALGEERLGRRPRGLARRELDALRLPNGKTISPCMRAWLAFDATFVNWFSDLTRPTLQAERVGQLALREYGADHPLGVTFESLQLHALPGECLSLPGGSESRRFIYLSEPDSLGEYPVLLIDVDDVPFVTVEYPGLDVYLGTIAGLVAPPQRVYGSYADDSRYRARMAHHIGSALGGKRQIELHDEGFPMDEAWPVDD